MNRNITLDAGALIALDRGDRQVFLLLQGVSDLGGSVFVASSALAQAIRRPERQARLSRLVRQSNTEVVALDRPMAIAVGRLLAASGTSDIADAHVALVARSSSGVVATSDPDDLGRLDPSLQSILV